MRDFRSALGRSQGGTAGVGEEIQHVEFPAIARTVQAKLANALPIAGLLGEEPEMAEIRKIHLQLQTAVADDELLLHLLVEEGPFAITAAEAGEARVHPVPLVLAQPWRPNRLR